MEHQADATGISTAGQIVGIYLDATNAIRCDQLDEMIRFELWRTTRLCVNERDGFDGNVGMQLSHER